MRSFALWVLVAGACGDNMTQPDAAPNDHDVWVEMPTWNAGPYGRPPYAIFGGPDDVEITPIVQDGWWRATMPLGGSVSVTVTSGYTPTSISTSSWTVRGVKPGDRFPRSAPKLPADCTCWTVDLVPDSTGYHWTDLDAAAVQGRAIGVVSPGQVPGGPGSYDLLIDHETDTHVSLPAGLSFQVTVEVAACSSDEWDRLRHALRRGCK